MGDRDNKVACTQLDRLCYGYFHKHSFNFSDGMVGQLRLDCFQCKCEPDFAAWVHHYLAIKQASNADETNISKTSVFVNVVHLPNLI